MRQTYKELIMGIRGELFSTKLILPNRTYFLNVKENRIGDLYLNIVESKNKETGGFERQSIIVFADDLPSFLGEFDKSLKVLEKAVREQKRSGKRQEETEGGREKPGERGGKERPERGGAAGRREKSAGERGGGKRVVVRKREPKK
jgi:hypothetical protein